MQSIQSKLSVGLLFSLIIAFSALWIVVSMNTQYLAEEYIASRLTHDAETLLTTVNFKQSNQSTDKTLEIDTSRAGLIYNQPFSGHYYVISSDTQTANSRSLWDKNLLHSTLKAGEQHRSLQQGPEQQLLLVISSGFEIQNKALTITVAEDLNPVQKNIRQFQYAFATLAFIMLFSLVILQTIILRRSLKPLSTIHNEIKLLEQGKLQKLSTDTPAELQPLINEVNRLLDITQQRLHRSRNALSDLAHAIKKPLTVIQQVTEKIDDTEETKNKLSNQAQNIYQLTDRILKRARLAGHSYSGTLFSLTEDLPELINTLEMMYSGKALNIIQNLPSDTIYCPIDREDMLELLGNILDNAYKWANKEIIINIEINSRLVIRIEDDGPGADANKINNLAQRGVRLDEKTEGHGFGLAIANDIVSDYNGTMKFSHSSTMSGLKIDIVIPIIKN